MTLPIQSFISERLLEYDPTFDTGDGISTTALMVKPLSIILQPLRDEMDEVEQNQSILTVLESDDPDAFDEDTVDALASNVFIERREGDKATGTVRVYYFSPQAVDIGVGQASFLDSSGNRFVNDSAVLVTEAEMSLNTENSLYYIDISLEAEAEGSGYNAEKGAIQTWENEPANVANVINPSGFSDGVDRETNTELIDRISVAVTVRALVSDRGIVTTMTDEFSTIKEINPRGLGDPEMQRDIVYNVHVGGHVDIWVKTPSFSESYQDIVGLITDTTRQSSGHSTVVMEQDSTDYALINSNIDRTNTNPTVKSSDGLVTYSETSDYTLDDSAGLIQRVASGSIFHLTGTTGAAPAEGVTATKTLTTTGSPWTSVRPAMQLKILSPSSVAGTYSVKTVSSNEIQIFGTFPTTGVGSVQWQIDDIVSVSYDYNPLSIDIIQSSRSSARSDYTITDVPLIKVKSIEVLDPATLEPTGTYLDPNGGFGYGGYGQGGFGIGTLADYMFKVVIPNLRFSIEESNYIDIKSSYLGYNLRITYDYAPEIAEYQTYVSDTAQRIEPAKLLVKHFIPVYVSSPTGITYRVSAANTTALSESDIQTAVDELIENTAIKTSIRTSDIIDLLYNSGASSVDVNFTLKGEIHNTDGTVEYVVSSDEGVLEIPERTVSGTELPDVDNPLSQEIAHFITDDVGLTRVTI